MFERLDNKLNALIKQVNDKPARIDRVMNKAVYTIETTADAHARLITNHYGFKNIKRSSAGNQLLTASLKLQHELGIDFGFNDCPDKPKSYWRNRGWIQGEATGNATGLTARVLIEYLKGMLKLAA